MRFYLFIDTLRDYERGIDVPAYPRPDARPQSGPSRDSEVQLYLLGSVLAQHFELHHRLEGSNDCRQAEAGSCEVYFGEWWNRYPISRDGRIGERVQDLRRRLARRECFPFWVTDYTYALLLPLVRGDLAAAAKFASFIGDDLPKDDDDRRFGKPERCFHFILARYLAMAAEDADLPADGAAFERRVDVPAWFDTVRNGRSVRARSWLAALLAIVDRDDAAFRAAFTKLAEHYRANEFCRHGRKNGVFGMIMREGSILWHLARLRGIGPAWDEMPLETSDHILSRESLGIRGPELPEAGEPTAAR